MEVICLLEISDINYTQSVDPGDTASCHGSGGRYDVDKDKKWTCISK